MLRVKYIRCHGSGNRFLLLNAVEEPRLELLGANPALIATLCKALQPCDGLLLTVRTDARYGMRMFNTDGSEAEMCGNGIRCVARQAQSYVGEAVQEFSLRSGGHDHAIRHEAPLFGTIPTYRVEIDIRTATADFLPSMEEGNWIGKPIPALDEALHFTYLNLGNPHLVAAVEQIDPERLRCLGERVKQLPEILPKGVNVSLFRRIDEQQIYTATYERGVGLTSSCGTAMTACSTAACLLGLCRAEEPIRVRNSGGMVQCTCHRTEETLSTSLSGNATFEAEGELQLDLGNATFTLLNEQRLDEEIEQYETFLETIR